MATQEIATFFSEEGHPLREEEILVDLHQLVCGGCGATGGAVAATKWCETEPGTRTPKTKRAVYCTECGRFTGKPLTIEEFPAGGWQAMADALIDQPPTKPFSVIMEGEV
jgi:hypothetical protein